MNADILRQRRNLIGMAIALSIYELAEGNIDKAPTFLGSIPVGDPDVVIYLAWSSLFYFLWRYWIHTKKLRDSMRKSDNNNLYYQSEERSYLFDIHNSLCIDEAYNNLLKSIFEYNENEYIIKVLNNKAATPILVRKIFKRYIDCSFYYNHNTPHNGRIPDKEQRIQVKLPYLNVFIFELRAQIKAIFIEKSFSDYCLPYYIAITPFIIYYVKNVFDEEDFYFIYNLICSFICYC